MDFQVILTSVVTALVSSSLISAGVIYVVKKSIDTALDYRFQKLLEESRSQIQETARRQAAVYDKQSETLKTILALTYRLRNTTRGLAEQLEKQKDLYTKEFRDELSKFELYHEALREIMFEERALLPEACFILMHDLRHKTLALLMEFQGFTRKRSEGERAKLHEKATKTFNEIDNLHQQLVSIIQAHIGVES